MTVDGSKGLKGRKTGGDVKANLSASKDLSALVLKRNIVRCYSDLKLNVPTRNCIGSLRSQDLCNDIILTVDW